MLFNTQYFKCRTLSVCCTVAPKVTDVTSRHGKDLSLEGSPTAIQATASYAFGDYVASVRNC